MKTLASLLLAAACALPVCADDTAKPAAPKSSDSSIINLPVSAATVSAPMTLTNGYVSQPEQTEVAGGGKAVFEFTVPTDGEYVIHALVNAPAEDANSFYINIDTNPEDPVMIWDIDVTNGFEDRVVSWRGSGEAANDEFSPKRFKLTAGAHKLILIGREAESQLKSLSLRRAP